MSKISCSTEEQNDGAMTMSQVSIQTFLAFRVDSSTVSYTAFGLLA